MILRTRLIPPERVEVARMTDGIIRNLITILPETVEVALTNPETRRKARSDPATVDVAAT
jgi:hypothetical protein